MQLRPAININSIPEIVVLYLSSSISSRSTALGTTPIPPPPPLQFPLLSRQQQPPSSYNVNPHPPSITGFLCGIRTTIASDTTSPSPNSITTQAPHLVRIRSTQPSSSTPLHARKPRLENLNLALLLLLLLSQSHSHAFPYLSPTLPSIPVFPSSLMFQPSPTSLPSPQTLATYNPTGHNATTCHLQPHNHTSQMLHTDALKFDSLSTFTTSTC